VIERRVQFRKKQIDAEIAQIKAEGEKEIARKVAAKEAERLKVIDQEALLAEHREEIRRNKAFRRTSRHFVFSAEEVAAIQAQYPGLDEEEARMLLSKRARQAASANAAGLERSESRGTVVQPVSSEAVRREAGSEAAQPVVEQAAKPVEAPKAVHAKPKPGPVHIAAAVTISSEADEDGTDPFKDGEWSDFNPDEWIEGQDYPEDRYREVSDRDGYRVLVPRTEDNDLSQVEVGPEVQALWDRERELRKQQDELISRHGQVRMTWPQSALDKLQSLSDEQITIGIQMEKLLEG
jgi:hypothetical protein